MYESCGITVMVSDFDKSIKFYTDTLGLNLKNRWGNEFAFIEAPGLTIGLHPLPEKAPKSKTPGGLSIGLRVKNIEEATNTLKGNGVEFTTDIKNDGYVRIIHFSDPDGNPLYLCEVEQK